MSRSVPRQILLSVSLLAGLLLSPALARADSSQPNLPSIDLGGHFVVGFGGSFGVELNGPKLIIGWAWDRAQVTLDIYGGALVLPPGPGAGFELSAEWVAIPTTSLLQLNQQSFGGIVGAHLGAKLASLSHPTFHVEAIGQYTDNGNVTYAFLTAGFPQLVELGVGHRLILNDNMGPYFEARVGYPMAINAELGITSVPAH
jgi:hypothetical protein